MVSKSFVVVSDAHVHPWSRFNVGDGLNNDRLQRTLAVLRASLDRARKDKIPWVFAGDLVHTAGYGLNVVTSALAVLFNEYVDVLKLVVWGNHDARSVGGPIKLHETIWGALQLTVENLEVLMPNTVVTHGGLTYSGVGGQPQHEWIEYPMQSDVGVYHGIVRGSKGPNGYVFPEGFDPVALLERHRVVIVGDLHHPQVMGNILIPGSLEHHNFGDAGLHGWWVVTVLDTNVPPRFEFIDSESPQFLTVQTTMEIPPLDKNFYRVLSGDGGSAVGVEIVSPGPTVIKSRGLWKGVSQDEILSGWIATTKIPAAADVVQDIGRQLLGTVDSGLLRSIRVQKLGLWNFGSYADAEFEIRDGVWLVLGKGRDYPSNGAGKTTLFESLFWLLFGRTTKGLTGDDVIRWGADTQCMVWGTFTGHVGTQLTVVRKRGPGSTLEVIEDGKNWEATSVNEMTDKLNKYLGVTPELFQALGYFSQEKLLMFASATDGERKEMLADLIGLATYQKASTQAGIEAAKLESEIALSEGMRRGTEERLVVERVTLQQQTDAMDTWTRERNARAWQAKDRVQQYNAGIEERRAKLAAETMVKFTQGIAERGDRLTKALSAIQAELSAPRAVTATMEESLNATAAANMARTRAIEWVTKADMALRARESMRAKLEGARNTFASGRCPMCSQPVTPEHVTQCLGLFEEEFRIAEEAATHAVSERASALDNAADLKSRADSLMEGWKEGERIKGLQNQRTEVVTELEALERERLYINTSIAAHVEKTVTAERQLLESTLCLVLSEENPHVQSQMVAASRVLEAEASLRQRADEQKVMRTKQAIYDYWRNGFSKQGIQSLLMEEVANVFNEARRRIIPVVTQGVYDVQFNTVSQTKAGELREKTEFMVFEHGQRVPYAALSGGQRRRIDIGVMLTLVVAASKWMGVPGMLGILVLDEVFGFLDANGSESLMDALREVQNTVPSVYVISHDQQFQAMFDNVITVMQDQHGVSHFVPQEWSVPNAVVSV